MTDSRYAVRMLPTGGDLTPVIRMRRDWVASTTLGQIPPPGSMSVDRDTGFAERFRRWWEREGDTRRTWLVWRDADAVAVGNVKIFDQMPTPDAPATHWVYVANLWVDPAHRSRGVGTLLMGAIADWAHAQGLTRLVLNPAIVSAPRFTAMGFRSADDLLHGDLDSGG